MTQALDKAARSNKTVKELAGRAVQDAITKAEQDPSFLEDIWAQVRTTGRMFLTWARGRYKTSPWWTILLGLGSLVYLISPIDLLPDFLVAGVLDDATLLGIFWASLQHDVKRFARWEERVAQVQGQAPDAQAEPAQAEPAQSEPTQAEAAKGRAKDPEVEPAKPQLSLAKDEPAPAEAAQRVGAQGEELGPELD